MSGLPKGWFSINTGSAFTQKSTTKLKVKSKDTLGVGIYPVVDQGAEFIAGYVDDETKVIYVNNPLCIFGDHTRVIKWIDFDFVPGADGTKVLAPASYLFPKFFYYQLKSLKIEDRGYSRHFKYLKATNFKVAPLNEQIRIANKLDSILAKVDKAQARLDKIPAILKRFRQSVLAAATSGELTKEWRAIKGIGFEEWTEMKLSEVATSIDPNPSHRYPKSDSSGVPILSTQQFVGESGWTTDKAKLVNHEFYEERKEKTGFFENDIIFARKGRLGLARFAPTNMEFVFSHTVFIVRASETVQSDYLLWYLRDEQSLEWLVKEMNSNTGVPTLGKGVFEKLPINLPCKEEQSEIVSRIERLFSCANKVEKQYLDAKARLDRLTQSILAKAFRGELVAQDPNDEPAEKLLERIVAEKEQNKSKKTTRKRTTKAKMVEKE
ncbi:restriction endonuclease subunit S [Photobacterium damselae subsp. damselae]